MVQIIPLPDRQSRTPSRVPAVPVEATILLFTGVRYERLEDEPARSIRLDAQRTQ